MGIWIQAEANLRSFTTTVQFILLPIGSSLVYCGYSDNSRVSLYGYSGFNYMAYRYIYN